MSQVQWETVPLCEASTATTSSALLSHQNRCHFLALMHSPTLGFLRVQNPEDIPQSHKTKYQRWSWVCIGVPPLPPSLPICSCLLGLWLTGGEDHGFHMGSQMVTCTNGNRKCIPIRYVLSFLYLKPENQSDISVYLGYFYGHLHTPISLQF